MDIDTIRDAKAVPPILSLLNEMKIKATFFIAMGRDDSGKNLLRAGPRVLRGAYLRRYGLNGLRGLLLPSVNVEEELSNWREILKEGHELGLHGYWHRNWSMKAAAWDLSEAERMVKLGLKRFVDFFGFVSSGFACPAFSVTLNILRAIENQSFTYTSNMQIENGKPFRPKIGDKKSSFIEMPVTCKNLEELFLEGFSKRQAFQIVERRLDEAKSRGEYFCYYEHPSFIAYVAPNHLRKLLENIVNDENVWPCTLKEAAAWWKTKYYPFKKR